MSTTREMSTMHDLDRTALAPAADDVDPTALAPSADDVDRTALAPSADEFHRTAFAPRGDDATSACAWASSPLGDPLDEENLPYGYVDFSPEPLTPAARRRPIDKLIVAAGLIGSVGAGAALGIVLFSGSPQPKPTTAVRSSAGAPAEVAAPVVSPPDHETAPALSLIHI